MDRLRLAGGTVRTTAEVVLAADDRLLFGREYDPATGYDELVYASATCRPRTATGSAQPGFIRPGSNRLVAARVRETAAGLTDSRLKTHAELRPAGATRC
jgi:hypothetical protein